MDLSQVIIGLTNPKSPTNVGGIMRAAGCYNATEVRYTGQRYQYAAAHYTQYDTDTQSARERIPLIAVNQLLDDLPPDTKIVCVELVEGAIALPDFEHPAQAIYIFGPEDGTIAQQVINQADAVVYVPTTGCMNLAATVNVLLYDRMAKSGIKGSDALIRASRDTNNRVKVTSANTSR
ncbi:RNA methyltransferase [Shewanella sp. NIFS-20-20]|uniref:RNA methyltransferase n=1 Tax=Shewanella sp. NIFS-20-20 TaxID=2853806 RepID=UPI001C48AE93|nr:RNA methyltransferase [Shewanella sp. NIFS-20-20]MBV7315213.1 RNA methyltransferase [Shewanella sp. NIFS-20-20]